MTKEYRLPSGASVLVDDEDYSRIASYRWQEARREHTSYAVTRVKRPHGGFETIYMHRLLMKAPSGSEVDHINRSGLDNRRSNLRLCNHHDNSHNHRKRKGSTTSRYIGVHWSPNRGKWNAQLHADGHGKHLGLFETEEDAALAYDDAARHAYGEFAGLNFPDQYGATKEILEYRGVVATVDGLWKLARRFDPYNPEAAAVVQGLLLSEPLYRRVVDARKAALLSMEPPTATCPGCANCRKRGGHPDGIDHWGKIERSGDG